MDVEGNDDGVVVRALRRADAPRLARMDQAITGRNRGAWYEGKLKRALEESDLNVSLGAELEGHLVGAVLGSLHYGEFGQPEPIAILDTILVDPGYARRGVGSALLAQLTRNLAALGIERLRTEVAWDEHELNRFLGHEGFAPAGRLVLEMRLAPETPERLSRAGMTGIMEALPDR
jgi:predicted N-acetyltransferase YhbS